MYISEFKVNTERFNDELYNKSQNDVRYELDRMYIHEIDKLCYRCDSLEYIIDELIDIMNQLCIRNETTYKEIKESMKAKKILSEI